MIASPETIWLARNVITRNAWISAIAAPASAATPTAAASESPAPKWKRCTAQKPMTAPISIIPSTPRLSTPDALREQLAERGVEQRRPVRDARRDHDDEQRVVHAASAAGASGARRPKRTR